MVKYYYRDTKNSKAQELENYKVGCWVDAQKPTEKELDDLCVELNLERGHLRDAMDPHEVPRLETESGTIYIFTRFPHNDGESITTSPILIVIGEKFIATISAKTPFFLGRLRERRDYFTAQKINLFLQIVAEIIVSYSYYLNQISKQIRSVEIKVEKITNRDIIQFVASEGIISDFRPSLVHTNAVLESLLKGKKLPFIDHDKDLVEDIVLSNRQLVEQSDDILRTIVNIRNAYTTIMTNNLNRVIKLLTSVTVILTIPTMIASLYGMNVRLPLEGTPWAFWAILLVIVLISAAILWVFVKEDFL